MRVKVWIQRFADRAALQLQWIDANGRRKTKSARTADEGEAERRRADLEYELSHGLHAEPGRMGWEAFRATFEDEYLSGKRPNTRKGYAATFNLFEEICRPGLLANITARTVSQFAAAMRKLPGKDGSPFKPATLTIRLTQLGSALAWAVRQGMLGAVPEFPEVAMPKKRPQPVPPEHVERVLTLTNDPAMTAYILCGWEAGMRRDEAYSLQWEAGPAPWLDLERNRIWFPAESAKGKEDQWLPITARLRTALERLPERSGRVFRFVGVHGKPLSSMALVERLATLARRAGLTLTMRTLRRGFGCRHAGHVPAQVLQRLMRHSDIGITMEFYCNIDAALEAALCNGSCNTMPSVPTAKAS